MGDNLWTSTAAPLGRVFMVQEGASFRQQQKKKKMLRAMLATSIRPTCQDLSCTDIKGYTNICLNIRGELSILTVVFEANIAYVVFLMKKENKKHTNRKKSRHKKAIFFLKRQ